VQMARDAGAKKVYFASAAPAVKYPNVYGIDMPAAEELIAHGRTDDEVGEEIGCDWMLYQDLDDLKDSVTEGNDQIKAFDTCVFDGQYVAGDVDASYLERLKEARNDAAKGKKNKKIGSNESSNLCSKID
ncbi:MAG: amidophosphoribosyltransferase, partial [Neptuniibacter sp.]|nr:amidophosphoribosyltransferase [Neptuniibacter sp.]